LRVRWILTEDGTVDLFICRFATRKDNDLGWRLEPVALKNLRAMKPGERLVIYHTGDEKSAVGTATVVSVDASDVKNPQVKIKWGRRMRNR